MTNASARVDQETYVQETIITSLVGVTATMLSGMGLDDARANAYAIVLAEKYATITTETLDALRLVDF